MSRSLIYVVQSAITEVSDGDIIPLGVTIHRFGQNIRQDGNTIALCNCSKNSCKYPDYYNVDVMVNLEPAAAGPVSVILQKDGVPVIGGTTTITLPAATVAPFPISPTVRVKGDANLSIKLEGADAKILNMTVRVTKE